MSDKPSNANDLPLEDTGLPDGTAPVVPEPAGRSRLFFIPLLFLALFTGAVIGLYFQPPGVQALFRATGLEPGGGTDTPIAVAIERVSAGEEVAVVSEGDVVALGRITPKGDVVTVAPPFGAGDARVRELRVAEGDTVSLGDVIAVLDSLAQYEGQLATAQANLSVAEASLAQTEASIRVGRDEAQAALDRALATETAAKEDLSRTTALMERGVTTKAVLDTAIARATEAARDVEKARASLSRYDARDGAPQADIAVALANVEASRAQVALAELDVDKAYVRAPQDGMVLDLHVRAGERPGSDGVADIGNTSEMSVEAEVYQTLIGRVAVGDPVNITAEAIDGTLQGTVSAIGLEIGRQSITSDDPAANTDARVVDVLVTLDPASSALAERFTNLEVVARIDAGRTQP